MSQMFAAIALGLMGAALQAGHLQQQPLPGVPVQASAPLPHSPFQRLFRSGYEGLRRR